MDIVSIVLRRHQNGPYLLLSILNVPNHCHSHTKYFFLIADICTDYVLEPTNFATLLSPVRRPLLHSAYRLLMYKFIYIPILIQVEGAVSQILFVSPSLWFIIFR